MQYISRQLSLLLLSLLPFSAFASKKVYADYHGVRYTRLHDGQLGRWALFAQTEKSTTGIKSICYNADLILPDGTRPIAGSDYPLAGMHSNLDPDYVEYQILTAKASGIDGFFIEWGFLPHENHQLLRTMQQVACKYGFEIGINWCDQWLYYDWITRIDPQINTREKKNHYFAHCLQYLVDSVLYHTPTAPQVNGIPVFYLFGGGGASSEEYLQALDKVRFPKDEPRPVVLRRWADWGKLEDNLYAPVKFTKEIGRWIKAGAVPTPWLPARVRPGGKLYPQFDYYAEPEDLIRFLIPFRDSIWLSERPSYTVKSGFVMPGMDNRGCAGWGRSHFFCIPRQEGLTYQQMWNFNLAHRDRLDMVFIASWSDFTEGHEIEPTVSRGYRDVEITLRNTAQFKGTEADYSGLRLPMRLFRLRKALERIGALGCDARSIEERLNQAAGEIAASRYAQATRLLEQEEQTVAALTDRIHIETIRLSASDLRFSQLPKNGSFSISSSLNITLPEKTIGRLRQEPYRGYLTFRYRDAGFGELHVTTSTDRSPASLFETVCFLRKNNSDRWIDARIELYRANISFPVDCPSFRFSGTTEVADIAFEFQMETLR